MTQHGFYIIKDEFFDMISDPYLTDNKNGNRPHYYCLWDARDGVYWMIPLSSRISKYKSIIKSRTDSGKSCDILHIVKMPDGRESVFLIQDMFPVTPSYVDREYTLGGRPLILTNSKTISIIDSKARKVLALIKRGVKFTPTQPDVMAVLTMLKE